VTKASKDPVKPENPHAFRTPRKPGVDLGLFEGTRSVGAFGILPVCKSDLKG
jgi:hypothetical protein